MALLLCHIRGRTFYTRINNSISSTQEPAGTKQPVENSAASEQQVDKPTVENSVSSGHQVAEPTIEVKKPQNIISDSLQSPTDPNATYGHKGKGYEFQIAETCDQQNPFQVITETHLNGALCPSLEFRTRARTSYEANESDQTQTIPMLEKLEQANLKPEQLHTDAGYVSGTNIVQAQDKGTNLLGPLPGKPPNPENISLADFEFTENDIRIGHCPNQKCPVQQGDLDDNKGHWANFSKEDCYSCPLAANCPVKGKHERRIEWDREKIAIARRHKETKTKEFKEQHKIRSGIEATNSELKNKHGAEKLKVTGYTSIDFAMVFKVLAINIKRMFLYVIDKLKPWDTDGVNIFASISCVLASFLAHFFAFARQQIYFALKGMNFDVSISTI